MGRAYQDEIRDSKFLKMCVTMESLLLRRGDEALGTTMAERVAFLLGGSLETRRKYAKHLKAIYGVRSDIVHEGQSAALDEWLPRLRLYAPSTVLRFMQLMNEKKWTTFDDFANWLEELRFS